MSKFERDIIDLVNDSARRQIIRPLNLGGVSGADGGSSGPPGGFIGKLPQSRVAYDTTEAGLNTTSENPSILDNLNHIRYRLDTIESGNVGSVWGYITGDIESQTDLVGLINELIGEGGGSPLIVDDLTPQIDGITDVFTLSSAYTPSNVFYNGVRQYDNYSYLDASLTLDFVPESGDSLVCVGGGILVVVDDLTEQIDDVTDTFTLQSEYTPEYVFYNGVRQYDNYVVTGDSITFDFVPISGDSLLCIVGTISAELDDLTSQVDGITDTFTLSSEYTPDHVFINGIRQYDNYSVVGDSLTFDFIPDSGDSLLVAKILSGTSRVTSVDGMTGAVDLSAVYHPLENQRLSTADDVEFNLVNSLEYQIGGVPGIDVSFDILDGDGVTIHSLTFSKGLLTSYTTS